jgi:flagellar hook-associated protein 2
VGKAASELSLGSYASATTTPLGVYGQNKFALVVGSRTYNLDITGNNSLTGLANAINNSGAPVNASMLNNGSSNYLSVTATNVGATTLTLNTTPQLVNLITSTAAGTETSLAGYPDTGTTAVSNSGTVNLQVGNGAVIPLNIGAANNLTGLMNAINGAGAGVTASITTTGDKNFLKVVASGGPTTITLNDTPAATGVSLITNNNQGGNSSFTLNGTISVANQASNVFSSVISGVTFTLQKSNAGTVNLSIATNPNQLTTTLQTFVNAYNALAAQVTQETGTGAGPLGGDSLIRDISTDLGQLSAYFASSSSTVRSLSDLGITFNNSGQMTLDPNVVAGFSNTQVSDAFKFFGSSNSGFAAFANNFTSLSDPISGSILNEESGVDTANTNMTNEISTLTARAALTHAANTKRRQAADALVAQLQSNQNTVNAEIQSVNYVAFGKIVNSNGQ